MSARPVAQALPPEVPPLRPAPGPQRQPAPDLPGSPHAVPGVPVGIAVPPDLAERLLERRIVLVGGHLDQPAADRAAAQLMLLDAESDAGPGSEVQLHLRCPDADADAAATLADTVELMHVPVRAVASGAVGGAALGVYVTADLRLASPSCLFQLREPTAAPAAGRFADLEVVVQRHQRLLAVLRDRLAAATGRTPDEIEHDLRAGRLLSGQEAVEYGLAHRLT